MITIDPPRWRNGPSICPAQNLPAFDTKSSAESYIKRYCPSSKITRMGKCDQCGHWHFEAHGPESLAKNDFAFLTLERVRECHLTMQRLAQRRGNKK